jgi:hypothetical protein
LSFAKLAPTLGGANPREIDMSKDGKDGASKLTKRAQEASSKPAAEEETVYHSMFVGFFRDGRDPMVDEPEDEEPDVKPVPDATLCERHFNSAKTPPD